jgi:hypothetical protein
VRGDLLLKFSPAGMLRWQRAWTLSEFKGGQDGAASTDGIGVSRDGTTTFGPGGDLVVLKLMPERVRLAADAGPGGTHSRSGSWSRDSLGQPHAKPAMTRFPVLSLARGDIALLRFLDSSPQMSAARITQEESAMRRAAVVLAVTAALVCPPRRRLRRSIRWSARRYRAPRLAPRPTLRILPESRPASLTRAAPPRPNPSSLCPLNRVRSTLEAARFRRHSNYAASPIGAWDRSMQLRLSITREMLAPA